MARQRLDPRMHFSKDMKMTLCTKTVGTVGAWTNSEDVAIDCQDCLALLKD